MGDTARVRLKELRVLPGNDRCADCGASEPEWTSTNLGIYVCIDCCGVHRNLGTHISKVRSIRLDQWTMDQVAPFEQIGNAKSNAHYEAQIPNWFRRPKPGDPQYIREAWIRAKYEKREFCQGGKLGAMDFNAFVASVAAQEKDGCLKRGMMSKKGKDGKKWAQRLFVLRDGRLYYYKTKSDEQANKPIGMIPLETAKFFTADGKSGRQFCLQVIDGTDDRSYFMQTENGKDIMDWINIMRANKAQLLKLSPSSRNLDVEVGAEFLAEGFLKYKSDPGKGSSNRCWISADERWMFLYKDPLNPFPLTKISLSSGARVGSDSSDPFALHMELFGGRNTAPSMSMSGGSGSWGRLSVSSGAGKSAASVIVGPTTIAFVADSPEERDRWVIFLTSICSGRS